MAANWQQASQTAFGQVSSVSRRTKLAEKAVTVQNWKISWRLFAMDLQGLEPWTYRMQSDRSTTGAPNPMHDLKNYSLYTANTEENCSCLSGTCLVYPNAASYYASLCMYLPVGHTGMPSMPFTRDADLPQLQQCLLASSPSLTIHSWLKRWRHCKIAKLMEVSLDIYQDFITGCLLNL